MEELYYAHPVQVRYWNSERHKYCGAICYHEFLIDATSGEACLIDKVLSTAANNGISADNAIIELDWININKVILGH